MNIFKYKIFPVFFLSGVFFLFACCGAIAPTTDEQPNYREIEVSFPHEEAGITLAGTLTVPLGAEPAPAVILITGSGPQDRDETVFGHKPFRVLADYLSSRGVAVLRVDDRGVGESTGDFFTATTVDFAQDTIACLRFLKTRGEVDPTQIGLIGHSEGGVIAPMVAVSADGVSFIVLMAGPAVPGDELILEQQAQISQAMGATEEMVHEGRVLQEQVFDILQHESDLKEADQQLRELLAPIGEKLPEEHFNQMIEAVNTAWMRFFIAHDPSNVLRQVKVPVLALFGERDLQVPPTQNKPVMEGALLEGACTDFEVIEYPEMNHLFQRCETGSPAEYAEIEETVAPQVLATISDWILRHTVPIE